MRKHLLAAVAALCAGPSFAASFVTSTPGPEPASGNVPSGLYTIDFNGPAVAGLSGNYHLVTGSVTSQYAQPFGGNTQYLSVPSAGATGQATLDLAGYDFGGVVTGFSLYWGSIDLYNMLRITTSKGGNTNVLDFAFNGVAPNPPPANGDQQTPENNRRVYFALDAGESVKSLGFISNGIAFEVDDIVFTGSAVPEPATWATMIAGFGLVGGAMRRRNRNPEQGAVAA